MATTFNPNNPVQFSTELNPECGPCEGPPYSQIVAQGDVTQLMIDTGTCGDQALCQNDFSTLLNMAQDPSFEEDTGSPWTAGTGWTIDTVGEKATHVPGLGAGAVSQTLPTPLDDTRVYAVRFTVSGYAGGTITASLGGALSGSHNSNGTFIDYIVGPFAGDDLAFTANTAFNGSIDDIYVSCWGFGTDWVQNEDDGNMQHVPTGFFTELEQRGVLTIGELYRVTFTVEDTSAGSISAYIGTVGSGDIESSGDFTFEAEADTGNFKFSPSIDFDGKITAVELYRINDDNKVALLDQDGNFIELITSEPQKSSQQWTRVSWQELDTEIGRCYRLGIFDGCVNTCDQFNSNFIRNGTFTTFDDWITGGDWSLFSGGGGRAAFQYTGALNPTLTQENVIPCAGFTYEVTYTILLAAGGTSYNIKLGNGQSEQLTAADGTYTVDIFVPSLGSGDFVVTADGNVGGPNNFSIDNISVRVKPSSRRPDYYSETFSFIGPAASSESPTLLLKWRNDENAFGFDYENYPQFVNTLRVLAVLRQARYPRVIDIEVNADNTRAVGYASSDKVIRLSIEDQAPHIHDALRNAVIHDTFAVDGVEYPPVEGDYEPNWRNSACVASSEIELYTQGGFNRNSC